MHRTDFPGARLDADLHLPVDLARLYTTMESMQPMKMGSSEAILVFARNPGQPPLELYFDRNSGLLFRELTPGDCGTRAQAGHSVRRYPAEPARG